LQKKSNPMKKLISILVLCFGIFASAQNDSISSIRRHEVKLNGLVLLAGGLEGYYEYNLNEESSVGVSAFVAFSDEFDTRAYLSPYYRVFFGKKYAAGFFFEGFGMLNTYETNTTDYLYDDMGFLTNINSKSENRTDFALGLGLGGKWVTSRNYIFEINGGVGRNLFNANGNDDTQFVGKIGFNFGYRF
jgi:hypothetical protein